MSAGRAMKLATKDYVRIYLTKPDVYPLIGIIAVALSFMTYKGVQHFQSPDVVFDRERRSAGAWEKYDAKEGEQWRNRVLKQYRHKEDNLRDLSVFEPLSASWWSRRAQVAKNPVEAVASGKNHIA